MKKTKKNYVLIALVVLLLALAVGYAAFQTNLTISGTATGTGTWDVKFTSAEITEGYGSATLSNSDTTVDVIANLAYPGDGCTVLANIKNSGNLPAVLTSLTLTDENGSEYANDDIAITLPEDLTVDDEIIAAGETCPVKIAIQWNADSTEQNVIAKFKVNFTYEQDTEAVTVTPSHGTHTTD